MGQHKVPSPSIGDPVPQVLHAWLQAFRLHLTGPKWKNLLVLVMGAFLAPGKRTVTACLCMNGRAAASNFTVYHKVLNRGRWKSHALARTLLGIGDGRVAFLSDRSSQTVDAWLDAANLEIGPLFRGLSRGIASEAPLDISTIRRIIKRAAHRAGLPQKIAGKLSGHSMHIGAAQDMMATGFDSLAIMQSGGWKTPHLVLRYLENASTRRLDERRWDRLEANSSR